MCQIIILYTLNLQCYMSIQFSIKLGEKGGCDGWLSDITELKGPFLPSFRSPAGVPHHQTQPKVKGFRSYRSCPFNSEALGGPGRRYQAQHMRQKEEFSEKSNWLGRYSQKGPLYFSVHCQLAYLLPYLLAPVLTGNFSGHMLFPLKASTVFFLATIPIYF